MKDAYFMNIARSLALKAKGETSPNPLVGALVVKNNRIVGQGYHKRAGGLHAEIYALNQAKDEACGSTMYVTLEPCSHFGRTPACLDKILTNRLRRVVIGMKDPNPLNNGKSIRLMRRRGINVKVGVLEKELKRINAPFIKYITRNIPYVTVKIAQSLDGKIATRSGDSKWITKREARKYTHQLRRFYDAILVGINTVLADNPKLTNPYSRKQPFKIVVDSKLKISLGAKLFKDPQKVIIATANLAKSNRKYQKLKKKGVLIIDCPDKKEKVDLKILLKRLSELGITNLLVEGGAKISGSFFDKGLVDKVLFVISPKIIGGETAISSVSGEGIKFIKQAINLKDIQIKEIGSDLLVEGSLK